ncbi:hypothetical protein [Mangrovibacterium sp.]|uniref:hypothetical protein n=1 Tax=Mangrovibacterium sp. TaxID=1961364 RepID=UPI003567B5D7
MKLLQQINLIERIDQLIRMRATGNPKELAERLELSQATVFRLIDVIKELGAPVEYNLSYQSYVYVEDVNFQCGFFLTDLNQDEVREINGGFKNLVQLTIF